jgi:hypothetical protein
MTVPHHAADLFQRSEQRSEQRGGESLYDKMAIWGRGRPRLTTHLSAKARPGKARQGQARQGKAGQGKTRPVAMDRIAGMRWAKMMKEGEPVRSWLAA